MPRVLFFPFGGYLTDRFGSKRSLIAIDIFKIVACIVVCLLFAAIAADVLLMKNTEVKKYSKIVTYLTTADQLSMLIGPAIAIFLVSYLPIKYFLLVVPIFYIYNLLNTISQKWKDEFFYCPDKIKQDSIFVSFKCALEIFKKFPILLLFSLQALVINFIISIVEAAGAPLVKIFFQKGDAEFGLLNIVAGTFGAISMIVTAYFITEKRAFYLSFFGAMGILISAYLCVFTKGFYLFIIFYGFIIAFTLINSLFVRILKKALVDASLLDKVTGMMMVINQISVPLAGLMISFLGDLEGIKNAMFYATNFLLFIFVTSFYFSYKYKNLNENREKYSEKIESTIIA